MSWTCCTNCATSTARRSSSLIGLPRGGRLPDMKAAQTQQDRIQARQADVGKFELPDWDPASLRKVPLFGRRSGQLRQPPTAVTCRRRQIFEIWSITDTYVPRRNSCQADIRATAVSLVVVKVSQQRPAVGACGFIKFTPKALTGPGRQESCHCQRYPFARRQANAFEHWMQESERVSRRSRRHSRNSPGWCRALRRLSSAFALRR